MRDLGEQKPASQDEARLAQRLARYLANWPAIDRQRWEQNCVPADPLDDPGYGSTLRLASRHKIARGYTYWLRFLDEAGWLDPAAPPGARISHARSAAWFRALMARGNAPFTIAGRFAELNLAIRVLAPEADRTCILQPNGASVRQRLFMDKRELLIPDARILYAEGLRLMGTAEQCRTRRKALLQFRDGLIFAVLSARARRLRTTAQTMATDNLHRVDGRYRIDYRPDQIKTGRRDSVLLPARLTPFIDRYLGEIRPALLRGTDHGALWVGTLGKPLAEPGIEKLVRVRSKALLGVAIGPHRFRHALGTTAPLVNRTEPGLARAVLDISDAVVAGHYNRANAIIATEFFHAEMLAATQAANDHARLEKIRRRRE